MCQTVQALLPISVTVPTQSMTESNAMPKHGTGCRVRGPSTAEVHTCRSGFGSSGCIHRGLLLPDCETGCKCVSRGTIHFSCRNSITLHVILYATFIRARVSCSPMPRAEMCRKMALRHSASSMSSWPICRRNMVKIVGYASSYFAGRISVYFIQGGCRSATNTDA